MAEELPQARLFIARPLATGKVTVTPAALSPPGTADPSSHPSLLSQSPGLLSLSQLYLPGYSELPLASALL